MIITVFIFVISNVINTKKVDATGKPCTLTCENGGACVNSTGTAVCTCVNGYTGSSCETGELNRPLIFFKILNYVSIYNYQLLIFHLSSHNLTPIT